MKAIVILLLGLVGVYSQANPAARPAIYSPQEMYLARQATGNFACKVDSIEVTLDVPGDEDKMVVSTQDLESYLSYTATIEWAHVNQLSFSSLDGRNDEKILGTPGADMGEFIQALHAYTSVSGTVLTAEEVDALFARHLKTMSRSKFTYETDERAYRKLAIATGCQNLKIAEIADKHKKQAILDKFGAPEMADYIGDPYIKFLALNSATLGINLKYITYALQAFHNQLWRQNKEEHTICYLLVKGKVDPKALINIKTPSYCVDQGLAPLVSSQICAGQSFIHHPDAVKLYRRELVQLILAGKEDNPQDVLATFNKLTKENFESFWATFVGVPTFTVNFKFSSPLLNNI